MLKFRAVRHIIKNGGATFNNKFKMININHGYWVSLNVKAPYLNVGFTFNNKRQLKDYIVMVFDRYNELKLSNTYFGVWVDENKVYFDCTVLVEDTEEALKLAKSNKQLAIFDNENKTSIYLKKK